MPEGMLKDVTVIDLSYEVAGPFCTKLLADQGARVIKIEAPGRGDPTRYEGPFPGGKPHPEKSALFLYLNTNKQGITLDITGDSGKAILRRLVKEADILVENAPPGQMAQLGLAYEDMAALNPGLVMTSVTPFGQSGPYKGFKGTEILYQALGGFLWLSGEMDREPVQVALYQAEIMGARNASLASMMALHVQRETGMGQHVDVSIMESVVSQPPFHLVQYAYTGAIASRGPRFPNIMDGDYIPCEDGYICLTTGGGNPWDKFSELFGLPQLLDSRFTTQTGRAQHWQELRELVLPALKDRKKVEFMNSAMQQRFVVGVVQSPQELLECRQLTDRDHFVEIQHPVVGRFSYPGPGFLADGSNPAKASAPAPLLGQHNEEVYCHGLGYSREEMVRLRALGVI